MARKAEDFLAWLHQERTRMEAERRRQKLTIKQWQEEELRRAEQAGLRVMRLSHSLPHTLR